MEVFIVLWTSICFFYGLFLFIKKLFIKNTSILSIQPMKAKWYCILLGVLSFFYIPVIFQKIYFCYLSINLPKIDKILWATFGSELTLLGLLIVFLYKRPVLWTSIQANTTRTDQTFKQAFDGFCQCLPLLLIVLLIWQGFLMFLIQLGIPIAIDPQPIIQLLNKHHPQSYSLVALGICVTIFAPLCEEIIFRGILLKFLANFFLPNKALWLNGLIFALAHQHFATLLPLMFLGYWLGLVYTKTNNIWANIGIHALFNGTNFALILVFK